jgi:protein TonB
MKKKKAKDINLNSADWCEMVFEGKNKSYGAYDMRQSSSKRHVTAFIITALFMFSLHCLPTLIAEVKKLTAKQRTEFTEKTVLSDVKLEDQIDESTLKRLQRLAPRVEIDHHVYRSRHYRRRSFR